jgi:hypothetical protein
MRKSHGREAGELTIFRKGLFDKPSRKQSLFLVDASSFIDFPVQLVPISEIVNCELSFLPNSKFRIQIEITICKSKHSKIENKTAVKGEIA